MRSTLLLCCLFFCYSGNAQIVNAESLRKVTDTSGWSGSMSANFALKRNLNDFLVLGTDVHVQYKMDPHLIIFKNDINFQKIEGNKFENAGITHVRYNYRFAPKVAWEIFVQGQYNRVNLIKFRALTGAGPRWKITNSEKYKFYLGFLSMLEYEEVTDGITPLQRELRGSTYLSFSIYASENVTLTSTSYYQPLWRKMHDYRISTQSSLVVGLFKNIALRVNYTFIYDAFPAVGIPKSQYDFSTGVAYSFD